MTFYQIPSIHVDLSKNMAVRGRGYFALHGYIENLKIPPPKVSGRFANNFVEMFLGWPTIGFLIAMLTVEKHGRQEAGLFYLIWLKWKLKKSFPTKVLGRFSNSFVAMFLGWPSISDSLKPCWLDENYGRQVAGLIWLKWKKSNQVSDPGPTWPSCLFQQFKTLSSVLHYKSHCINSGKQSRAIMTLLYLQIDRVTSVLNPCDPSSN